MRRLSPVVLPAWTLPLIVLALTLPVVIGTYLANAPGGLIGAAATVATLVVIAARARYDEPIEVPRALDGRYHVLAVAIAPLDEPALVESVATASAEGTRALAASDAEVLVLAPATNRPLAHWLSDLRAARDDAQRRLTLSLASLAAAGLDARGQVGDSDPVQAVEDTLRTFPAHEVVFVTPPEEPARALGEVRRRLDRPVRHLTADRQVAREPRQRAR